MAAHCFFIDDLWPFVDELEEKGYRASRHDDWIEHAKVLSKALVKTYARPAAVSNDRSILVRVSFELTEDGKPLHRLVEELKRLNRRYRLALPGWKTRPKAAPALRRRRWRKLQTFFRAHAELVSCFVSENIEGLYSFRLEAASTPREQAICLQFVKAIKDSLHPHGIVRGRRGADEPLRQRDGWIKRFAQDRKKRGGRSYDIVREIQKRLRDGTWNERASIHYNIANTTVCKIAGVKIPRIAPAFLPIRAYSSTPSHA